MAEIPSGTKFLGVGSSVPTPELSGTAINSKTQYYTIEDLQGLIRPYKVYSALLTQSGTDAPVATVLENTLGDVVWSRGAEGYYICTSNGLFTIDKTGVFIEPSSNLALIGYFQINDKTINTIEFTTAVTAGSADNGLHKTLIEIRVYN